MKNSRHHGHLLTWTVLFGLALPTPAFAQDNVKELKEQLEALRKRIDELEASQADRQVPDFGMDAFGDAMMPDMFAEIQQMQERMNRLFERSMGSQGLPDIGFFTSDLLYDEGYDLKETKDGYQIKFDISGLDQNGINIQVKDQSVTLSGVSRGETEQHDGTTYMKARSYGSFMKTVALPEDADTSGIETRKENGTLIINIPKKT